MITDGQEPQMAATSDDIPISPVDIITSRWEKLKDLSNWQHLSCCYFNFRKKGGVEAFFTINKVNINSICTDAFHFT